MHVLGGALYNKTVEIDVSKVWVFTIFGDTLVGYFVNTYVETSCEYFYKAVSSRTVTIVYL